ncbi:HAMP domain-containing histidine kinase [Clostridium sp. SHJSY1]|nr:HAMP domain-containing histidine kinase [Clostridium sp. SHJSY1]
MKEETNKVSSLIENNISKDDILNEIIDFGSASNCLVIITDKNFNIEYTSATNITNNNSIIQNTIQVSKIKLPYKTQQAINIFKAPVSKLFNSIIIGNSVDNSQKGYIIIQSFIEPINETISILKQQLIIICFISLLIGSGIAFIFANKFSKPILEINKASQKIAGGDYSTVISITSKDEISTLAKTINNMAKQLKETDNIKKKFLANISHELKTPISSIQAYGELILDYDDLDKNERHKYAEIIIMNSKKLTSMVENILEISAIQSGSYVLQLSSFSLILLIKDIISDIQVLIKEKNIKITLETFNDTLIITADKDKIHSVFCNLLGNAIKHSPINSFIEIKLQYKNNTICVCIIDNGEGISRDELPYIWDRFYKSNKSKNSRTGLGMAIIKEILELHNYEYGIKSKIGIGTSIWFNIPYNNNCYKRAFLHPTNYQQ